MDGDRYKLSRPIIMAREARARDKRNQEYAAQWEAEQAAAHREAGNQLMDGAKPTGVEIAAEKTQDRTTER